MKQKIVGKAAVKGHGNFHVPRFIENFLQFLLLERGIGNRFFDILDRFRDRRHELLITGCLFLWSLIFGSQLLQSTLELVRENLSKL